jgi:hypothetical protein
MMLLEMARAVGIAADHVTHLGIVLHPRDPWAEPERRARKARSAGLSGKFVDRDRIGQCPRNGLVDEDWLSRLKDGTRLGEMGPSVHAFEQDHVHFLEQLVDRIDDLDPVLVMQLLGVTSDAVPARGNVGAAARVTRDDADPGQLCPGLWVVQQLGESGHVRGVQADDARP